jgi:hypothetical protein
VRLLRNQYESGVDWQQIGPYRDVVIWVRKLRADCWAAAVTPLPAPPESIPGIALPSGEMILPEGFACQEAAVEAAQRYFDREQEPPRGDPQAQPKQRAVKRRHFARMPVALPVIGQAPQFREMPLPGVVRSVSPGGLMVEFPVIVVRGSLLRLAVQTGLGPVEMEGRVVWTTATRGTIRHGLAFPAPKSPDFAADWHLAEGQPRSATARET